MKLKLTSKEELEQQLSKVHLTRGLKSKEK